MQPPLRLDLSPAQRAELERRLRVRTTERRVHERLAMVQAVADGATVPQAARALGGHPQTVRQVVKRLASPAWPIVPAPVGRVVSAKPICWRWRSGWTRTRGPALAPGRCPN